MAILLTAVSSLKIVFFNKKKLTTVLITNNEYSFRTLAFYYGYDEKIWFMMLFYVFSPEWMKMRIYLK